MEWILALLHTNELKGHGTKEHLLGISSGCPAGPRRRRCPLRLVPFWTPPAKTKRRWVGWITRCWTGGIPVWRFAKRSWGERANEILRKGGGRGGDLEGFCYFNNVAQHASTKQPLCLCNDTMQQAANMRAHNDNNNNNSKGKHTKQDDKDYKPSLSLQVESKRQEEAEVENRLERERL